MSYCMYDIDGYVGNLATTHGLELLRYFISEKKPNSKLAEMIELGGSLISPELIQSIERINSDDPDIGKTLMNLKSLVKKCKVVAIINNELDGDG